MKKIPILRAGTFTPLQRPGSPKKVTITDEDLIGLAKSFNAQNGETPLVLGHPTNTDLTAPVGKPFGTVKALEFADGVLSAIPKNVDPDFSSLVKKGKFPSRSAGLKISKSDGKILGLSHIGFLGKVPPAVDNLPDVVFAGLPEDTIFVEFAEPTSTISRMFSAIREWLIEQKSIDEADKVLSKWDIEYLDNFKPEGSVPEAAGFAKGDDEMDKELLAAKTKELDDREAQLKVREEAQAQKDETDRKAAIVAFAEGLVKDGKILPRQKDGFIGLLNGIGDTVTIVFASGKDNAPVEATGLEAAKRLLSEMPKAIEFKELAGGEVPRKAPTDEKEIAKAARQKIDAAAKEGKTLSAAQAVQEVTAE